MVIVLTEKADCSTGSHINSQILPLQRPNMMDFRANLATAKICNFARRLGLKIMGRPLDQAKLIALVSVITTADKAHSYT